MILGDVVRMQQVLLILLRQTLDNNIFKSEVYVSTSHAGGMLSVIISNSQKQGGAINMHRAALNGEEGSISQEICQRIIK